MTFSRQIYIYTTLEKASPQGPEHRILPMSFWLDARHHLCIAPISNSSFTTMGEKVLNARQFPKYRNRLRYASIDSFELSFAIQSFLNCQKYYLFFLKRYRVTKKKCIEIFVETETFYSRRVNHSRKASLPIPIKLLVPYRRLYFLIQLWLRFLE